MTWGAWHHTAMRKIWTRFQSTGSSEHHGHHVRKAKMPLSHRWLRQTILHIRYLLPPAKKKTEHISTYAVLDMADDPFWDMFLTGIGPSNIQKHLCGSITFNLQTDGPDRPYTLI